MKTTVFIVSIFIGTFFSNIIFAQANGEFKLSYGYSGVDLLNESSTVRYVAIPCGISNGITTVISIFSSSTNSTAVPCKFEQKNGGTISINYNKTVNEKVSVGGQLNISNYKYRLHQNKPWTKKNTIAPYAKVEYRYIHKPKFEMYSSAMLGIMSRNKGSKRSMLPSIHFTALGFRHGIKHAIFYELGLGFGHLISIGYSAKI